MESEEDESHVSTPVASHQPSLSLEPRQVDGQEGTDAFKAELASIWDSALQVGDLDASNSSDGVLDPVPRTITLPIPSAISADEQSTFVLPEIHCEEVTVSFGDLPLEAQASHITVDENRRFVETSSGVFARELKRLYDQRLGVGKGTRSPFVITGFINQHGSPMYRVGRREMSAPAASAEEAEEQVSRAQSIVVDDATLASRPQSFLPSTNYPQAKRRSRVSVHSFFTSRNGAAQPLKAPLVQDGTRSPPTTRRLRKTRSIPNMAPLATPAESIPATTPVHLTGRPHAHSVSSVDVFRPPVATTPTIDTSVKVPQHDAFASIMTWSSVPPSPLSSGSGLRSTRSFYSPSERPPLDLALDDQTLDVIRHPFGRGVVFDIPSLPSSSPSSPSYLTSPPTLREMQSFESGLTARADPNPRSMRFGKLRARVSDESVHVPEAPPSPELEECEPESEPVFEPLADTLLHSRYSTDLFNVLQNYKGIPILDKLANIADPPTIKLSLNADETAVPRDDPRFVIWGELDGDDLDQSSASRSATDLSAAQITAARRKSTKDRHLSASDQPFIQTPSSESPKRVLVAATIERWIAQLTSELNYDELLIFFLTYRTYISALDLGHLLICRFHWALGHPSSPHDEMVRRIVRARTFIAIRYWLLTFFSVDFVPNRELRMLFANWLNALRKDPILKRHKDATNIVQKLRKVVLDCKDAHTHGTSEKERANEKSHLAPDVPVDLSSGNFAEALRRAVGKDSEDTDIDLDFDDVQSPGVEFGIQVNAPSPTGNPATAVDLAMMRQPLHLAFLHHGKANPAAVQAANYPPPVPLPVPHSAISRVVVNAIGRLGRWKRVMNYRTSNTRAPIRPPLGLGGACVDASSFDIEANETGDLLMTRGGVEHYLKMVEGQMYRKTPAGNSFFQALSAPPPLGLVPGIASVSDNSTVVERESLEPVVETPDEGNEEVGDAASVQQSLTASSEASLPASSVRFRHSISDASTTSGPTMHMDVVSIDDLDLSDLSSEDLHAPPPPGLRRMPRRLPNRRDFELVRRSVDSVSSMGVQTRSAHDSVLSAGSSVTSSVSIPNGPELGTAFHQWQMDAIVDSLSDDEEEGDVDAALRRLEGQINKDKQKHKQSKVDGWVQSIRERLANGHFGASRNRYSSDEEDYGEVQKGHRVEADGRRISQASTSHVSSRNSTNSGYSPFSVNLPSDELQGPPVPPGLGHELLDNKVPAGEGKPASEDVLSVEKPQSRAPSRPSTAAGSPHAEKTSPTAVSVVNVPPDIGLFVKPEKHLRRHRSFILSYKSDTIAQHFALIDRELFLSLKFEELVSQDWMASTEAFNVLDWAQYLRERAQMKQEGRLSISALTVARSRFNLVVNFVISEIMLTHPAERIMIFSKFVRIAWKAYLIKNYHLLVAVLAGLDSQWVQRALRQTQAKKPGMWENRMLRDLRQWSTSEDDFKHIRQTVDALAEPKSMTASSPDPSASSAEGQPAASRSRAASEGKPPTPPACVPFFGVYLSQLYRYGTLPDLIDPTAPHLPVGVDPDTNTFEPPAQPQVFSYLTPLPTSVQLEPLINVHKQRLVAGVVKSFVAGQHLAAKVSYTSDRKLFQKCFKLRGLDSETLLRVHALYANWES